MTDSLFADLHHRCGALGTRLFTLTALDTQAGLFRRAYTSHSVEYPVFGTKPLERDGWYDHCIRDRLTFVANSPDEFARYFFDHELITSLGLGSCINIPLLDSDRVFGTVNLLAEAGHFTPDRLAAYGAIITAAQPELCAALSTFD